MSLLNLVNELLLFIADNLKKERDINAFIRINYCFNYILNPYLYRHNVQYGGWVLIQAAKQGQKITAQMLYNAIGIEEIIRNPDYCYIILCWAAKLRHKVIVQLLLKSNPKNSRRLLLTAIRYRQETTVKLLLKSSNINYNDKDSYILLLWAIQKGHIVVVQLLLDCEGINTDIINYYSQMPLILAVDYRHYLIVKLLLKVQRH